MCGEQLAGTHLQADSQGSPPRVRGTASDCPMNEKRVRITPACAGNRIVTVLLSPLFKDHPRVCGEQSLLLSLVRVIPGSPPRVRGTVCGSSPSRINHGITPACAGNRSPTRWTGLPGRDHPRVCGEQRQCPMPCTPLKGSPPRVRGTASVFVLYSADIRITPACAGNRVNQNGPAARA